MGTVLKPVEKIQFELKSYTNERTRYVKTSRNFMRFF